MLENMSTQMEVDDGTIAKRVNWQKITDMSYWTMYEYSNIVTVKCTNQ